MNKPSYRSLIIIVVVIVYVGSYIIYRKNNLASNGISGVYYYIPGFDTTLSFEYRISVESKLVYYLFYPLLALDSKLFNVFIDFK